MKLALSPPGRCLSHYICIHYQIHFLIHIRVSYSLISKRREYKSKSHDTFSVSTRVPVLPYWFSSKFIIFYFKKINIPTHLSEDIEAACLNSVSLKTKCFILVNDQKSVFLLVWPLRYLFYSEHKLGYIVNKQKLYNYVFRIRTCGRDICQRFCSSKQNIRIVMWKHYIYFLYGPKQVVSLSTGGQV